MRTNRYILDPKSRVTVEPAISDDELEELVNARMEAEETPADEPDDDEDD